MSSARHAEIVGGGIGGLTAAAALARRGWRVRLHERGDQMRALGAGIYIYENGLRVLDAVGALPGAIAGASLAQTREVRDRSGAIISVHQWGATGRVYSVARQRLIDALVAAAVGAGAEIVTSSSGTHVAPDGTLTLAGGEAVRADLVVAADGVNSRLRQTLDLLQTRQAMRDGAIRVLIDKTPQERALGDTGTTVETWSGSRRILLTPCSDTEIYVALTMLDTDAAARRSPIDVEAWTASFPHLAELIARIGPGGRYDRFEFLTLKRWSSGRVALLGDAAHAMPPNIGQGGGCAMMNALALATHLDAEDDVPAALREWERRERPVTEHAQRISMFLGRATNWPAPLQRSFFSLVGRSRWMGERRTRTARHIPTGTV